ncbi:MAG TPA: high-potential iron-sulfur protein [Rhodothermales bacterium]
MHNRQHTPTRRDFLRRLSLGSVILSMTGSCGSGDARSVGATTASASGAAPACPGVDDLTEQQKQARTALKYTDTSPHADKRCNNCGFYRAPKSGQTCGTCSAIPGPVHPSGHCNAWAAKV